MSLTFARLFSSSSALRAAQKAKVPLQVFGIDGRYATALYTAAVKDQKLEQVEKDIVNIRKIFDTNKDFQEFIRNPILQKHTKQTIVGEIMKKIGVSSLTANLFDVMTENNRLKKTGGVLKSFQRLMSAHRGEVMCEVTTAAPLDSKSLAEVTSVLQGFLDKGQTLTLEPKVDPSIIGGMLVSIGDRFVDMSTASKLRRLNELIAEPVMPVV